MQKCWGWKRGKRQVSWQWQLRNGEKRRHWEHLETHELLNYAMLGSAHEEETMLPSLNFVSEGEETARHFTLLMQNPVTFVSIKMWDKTILGFCFNQSVANPERFGRTPRMRIVCFKPKLISRFMPRRDTFPLGYKSDRPIAEYHKCLTLLPRKELKLLLRVTNFSFNWWASSSSWEILFNSSHRL